MTKSLVSNIPHINFVQLIHEKKLKFDNMNTDNLKNETPADAKPVLSAVKIGRKEYPVKKGDYILYNGACYQFCSGDGRTLKLERYTQYTNLRLPDAMVKKIPFNDMQKQNYKSSGMDLVRWFF